MFKINLLCTLIFIASCDFPMNKEEKSDVFRAYFLKSFSFVDSLIMNKSYSEKSVVSRPVGTWVRLVESKSRCLDYKIPTSKYDGVLSISKCEKLPVEKPIFKLEEIRNLKISLSDNIISSKEIRNANYGLNLSYEFLGKHRKLRVLTFNLKRIDHFSVDPFYKYDSHSTKRWKNGLRVKNNESLVLRDSSWEGSSKNDYLQKKINFCFRVDHECSIVKKNTCDSCLNGWVEVVDYNCDGESSKVCAPLECGAKGMPACSRGTHWKGIKLKDMCFNDSPAGYCQKGLKTICDENKILSCI